MAHIHELFDFVISVFIVNRGRVLLVHHKTYDEWLPIGGHIELNEDPEEALWREVREESGLRLRLLHRKPAIAHPGVKPLPTPAYMDVHKTGGKHRHIAFVYFASSVSSKVRLLEREHHDFKWFLPREWSDRKYGVTRSIQFYCREALRTARQFQSRSRRSS